MLSRWEILCSNFKSWKYYGFCMSYSCEYQTLVLMVPSFELLAVFEIVGDRRKHNVVLEKMTLMFWLKSLSNSHINNNFVNSKSPHCEVRSINWKIWGRRPLNNKISWKKNINIKLETLVYINMDRPPKKHGKIEHAKYTYMKSWRQIILQI